MSTIKHSHLRPLAIFVTVVDAGSFAGAARKLRSSRSRISEQVSSLESDLGVRLLQRTTRQLTITEEGKRVYQRATQLLTILEDIEAIRSPAKPSGQVTITVPHDVALEYMLPILNEFRETHPEIQLNVILDDHRLDLIAEEVDLAIRIGIPRDDSLVARVMHEDRVGLFASPTYLKTAGSTESLKDLESHHWITLSQLNESTGQHFVQHNRTVVIKPESYYRCNSQLMIKEMIIQGLGIGKLLLSTVRQHVEDGKLIQLMPSLSSEPMVFSLTYPSRHQVPLRTRTVINYLLEKRIFERGVDY